MRWFFAGDAPEQLGPRPRKDRAPQVEKKKRRGPQADSALTHAFRICKVVQPAILPCGAVILDAFQTRFVQSGKAAGPKYARRFVIIKKPHLRVAALVGDFDAAGVYDAMVNRSDRGPWRESVDVRRCALQGGLRRHHEGARQENQRDSREKQFPAHGIPPRLVLRIGKPFVVVKNETFPEAQRSAKRLA